jgi:hypothetical protein
MARTQGDTTTEGEAKAFGSGMACARDRERGAEYAWLACASRAGVSL